MTADGPIVVSEGVVPLGEAARLETQRGGGGVVVEHLHSLDGQRAAQQGLDVHSPPQQYTEPTAKIMTIRVPRSAPSTSSETNPRRVSVRLTPAAQMHREYDVRTRKLLKQVLLHLTQLRRLLDAGSLIHRCGGGVVRVELTLTPWL